MKKITVYEAINDNELQEIAVINTLEEFIDMLRQYNDYTIVNELGKNEIK